MGLEACHRGLKKRPCTDYASRQHKRKHTVRSISHQKHRVWRTNKWGDPNSAPFLWVTPIESPIFRWNLPSIKLRKVCCMVCTREIKPSRSSRLDPWDPWAWGLSLRVGSSTPHVWVSVQSKSAIYVSGVCMHIYISIHNHTSCLQWILNISIHTHVYTYM